MNANNPGDDKGKLYKSQNDKLEQHADLYDQMKEGVSRYLSYRDIPELLKQYVQGTKALDYGSGTGISTRFLLKQGYDVTGSDVSPAMLEKAGKNLQGIKFSLIENGVLPYGPDTYDLVFSSLVLFEIGNEREMLQYLSEAKRVLKKDGIFLVLAGTQHMYSNRNLYAQYNDYPENQNLKSGNLVKVHLRDVGLTFEDYYWSEEDYKKFFKTAGFNIIKTHYPLGQKADPYPWKDEKLVSPFVLFLLKKE